ncbi:MAG: site-specific integrase [Pseudomonadota bacterium]
MHISISSSLDNHLYILHALVGGGKSTDIGEKARASPVRRPTYCPILCPQTCSMPEKLMDRLRYAIRVKGYSIRTEKAYVRWALRYIRFHKLQHPKDLSGEDVGRFLSHLAVDLNVAPNTQNQALSALLFLYRNVLHVHLEGIDAVRAKKPSDYPLCLLARRCARYFRAYRARSV